MRQRPLVLGELHCLQQLNIFYSFNRCIVLVLTKMLLAEHCQTLFEAQLKPISQGNAVARPVMEIFMPNHGFHALKTLVSGGVWMSQDTGGIKNIKPFV